MRGLLLTGTFLPFRKFDGISSDTVVRCYHRKLGSIGPLNTGSIYQCKNQTLFASPGLHSFVRPSQHVRNRALMEPQPAFRLTRSALLAVQLLVRLSQKLSTKISQPALPPVVPQVPCVTISAFARVLTDLKDQNEPNQSGARYPRTTQPTGRIICRKLLLSEPSSAQPHLRAARRISTRPTLTGRSSGRQALQPQPKLQIKMKAQSTRLPLPAAPLAHFATTYVSASNCFSSNRLTSFKSSVTLDNQRSCFLQTVRGPQAANGFFMSFGQR